MPVVDEMERAVDVLVCVGALASNTPALVEREREALQGFLSTERVGTLTQVDTMGRGWVDHAFDRAEGLVNQIFLGLLGLTALLVLGLLGAAALLPRRGGGRGSRLPWGRSPRGRAPAGEAYPDEAPSRGPRDDQGPPGVHPGEPHH